MLFISPVANFGKHPSVEICACDILAEPFEPKLHPS